MFRRRSADRPTGRRPDFSTRVAWDHVDGAIAVAAAQGAYLDELRRAGKAVALPSNDIPGFDAPVAIPDNDGGSRAAVHHLLEHGHRRIGFVGNFTQFDMRERYAAFHDAFVEAGLEPRPEDHFPSSNNVEDGGEESATAFLQQCERSTAVVVATDPNALGFMRTVIAAGLDVPRDVAARRAPRVVRVSHPRRPRSWRGGIHGRRRA